MWLEKKCRDVVREKKWRDVVRDKVGGVIIVTVECRDGSSGIRE